MTIEEFEASTAQDSPPSGISPYLKALWHAARGNWDTAHAIVQDLNDAEAAWVHAYLHRQEGDPANAAYWYGRANRPVSTLSLAEEWQQITTALL